MISEDAALALLCAEAEAAFAVGGSLTPAAPPGHEALGWVTGVDLLRGPEAGRVFYGWLCQAPGSRPGSLTLAIRGTCDLVEWARDADARQVLHPPSGGKLHAGFAAIFDSLALRLPGDGVDRPLAPAVAALLRAQDEVVVAGHSLGAPLAQYTVAGLAQLRDEAQVRGRFYAPPRAGDTVWGRWFDALVPEYRGWAYEPDLVPKVPFGFGYAPLPRQVELDPATIPWVRIRMEGWCNHHAACYAALLDAEAAALVRRDPRWAAYAGCLA